MRVIWLLALCACATLNTSGMSPQCRDLYNACLNSCPQQLNRVAGSDLESLSKAPVGGPSLDPGTAGFTNRCNENQRSCR